VLFHNENSEQQQRTFIQVDNTDYKALCTHCVKADPAIRISVIRYTHGTFAVQNKG